MPSWVGQGGKSGELFMVIGKNNILFLYFYFLRERKCVVFPFVCVAATKKTKDLAKTALEKDTLGHSSFALKKMKKINIYMEKTNIEWGAPR